MDPDLWAAIAAWIGVFVALAAAIYTGKQARRAQQALRYASEQAEAAKDQAASAREALDLARKEHLRADKPTFDIELKGPANDRCRLVIRMIDGPPGIHAQLSWSIEYSWPAGTGVSETEIQFGQGPGTYDLFKNGEIGAYIDVKPRITKASVRVEIVATDMADQERTWTDAQVASWHALPPPQIF